MTRWRRTARRMSQASRADDEGSVMLLTIGYAVLALAVVLVCVDATSLYLAQKHLDGVADAAALAAADGFTLDVVGGEPVARLSDAGITAQAEEIVAASQDAAGVGVELVSASTDDGVSARVTVAAEWHPPVLSIFVPEGVPLESTATSRTALR